MIKPTVGWFINAVHAVSAADNPDKPLGGISIDSRTIQEGETFWALRAERDGHDYVAEAFRKGARWAVVQKDWTPPPDAGAFRSHLLQVADTREALIQAAAQWRLELKCTVIGITGSNGKTSTKDLMIRLLSLKYKTSGTKGNFNNELGMPISLLDIPTDSDITVLELGASEPYEIGRLCSIARPTHGMITSISGAHLEGFGSIEVLAETKGELYDFVSQKGIAFVPVEDPLCVREAADNTRKIGYGFRPAPSDWTESYYLGENLTYNDAGQGTFRLEGEAIVVPVPGKPAALTALAALTAARELGVPMQECRRTVSEWRATPGRTEILRMNELIVLNDTYNANPESMRAAVDTLSRMKGGRRIAVLGDMNELGPDSNRAHRDLGKSLSPTQLDRVIFIGQLSKLAADEAAKTGIKTDSFKTCEDFLPNLETFISRGDRVLIKGSRTGKMECIIDRLQEIFG